jgi:hypothetical protein
MRRFECVALLIALAACRADGSKESAEGSDEGTGSSESTDTGQTETGDTDGDPSGFVTVLSVGTDVGAFSSVWGSTEDDVWAVGGQRDMDGGSQAVVYRRDASGWAPFAVPPDMPMLNWVWGVDGEVWVVGLEGAIWSWDGDWIEHESGTDRVLWGTWGPSSDRLWAVGGNALDDDPVLLQWDGNVWSEVELPQLEGNGLLKVWGTGPDDVLAVGDKGITIHHDGETWTAQDSASIADLVSLWGTGPTDILSVGGRANGRLARWDGSGWQGETVALPGLNGVWMDARGTATIVGDLGTVATVDAGSFEPTPEESDTVTLLHAVYGFESGLRIAVGGNLTGAPPFYGVILESAP